MKDAWGMETPAIKSSKAAKLGLAEQNFQPRKKEDSPLKLDDWGDEVNISTKPQAF